jgi:ubiquinol-cytochrome c reductase core subunit 2
VLPILKEVVTKTEFPEYKLEDVAEQVAQKTEYFSHKPELQVFDALHRAAFRSGLGNSLFASPSALASVEAHGLAEYAAARTAQNEITVVGHNVSLEELTSLAEPLFESGKTSRASTVAPSKYFGGNVQIDAATEANHAAVAFEAPALGASGYAAAQVLRGLLGNTTPAVKWGSSASALAQPVKTSAGESADAAAFHLAYADAGLFGLHASGSGAHARDALKAAVELLKSVASGKATEKDLSRAKNAAKFAASRDASGSRVEFVEEFGRQVS